MSERSHDSSQPDEQTGLQPGDTLDKFEIIEQVGAGGMSVVWKGYDRLIDRYVAVKQLAPESSADETEALRSRFRTEAAIQKRVGESHKHLTRVIEFVDDSRGLFIVMEFVDGSSLEQLLAESGKPMERRKALGIVGATALALEALHERDVLHRDLKPSNILLPNEGGLKVSDFGLAAMMAEQDVMSLGSVRYMAPELFADEPADARADIYSLGMIAYEMLAGRSKFDDAFRIVLRDQRNQALRWMKWHTNPRAKAPPLAQLNHEVPPPLSDLVARMMEKDPAQRIGSARELIDVIRRHFDAGGRVVKSISKQPEPRASSTRADPAEATAPLPKRSRMPLVLICTAVVLALVALGVWGNQWQQKRDTQQQVLRDAEQRYREAYAAYKADEFAEARRTFEQLANDWPDDTQLGRKSRARAALCAGAMHLTAARATQDADDLGQALDLYRAARAAFDKADEFDVLEHAEVRALTEEVDHRAAFIDIVTNIHNLIDDEQYNEAGVAIKKARKLNNYPIETQLLNELGTRIAGLEANAQIESELAEARDKAAQGNRQEAVDYLERAYARYHDPRIKTLRDELRSQMSHDRWMGEAKAAEQRDDLQAAIDAYRQVLTIESDAAIERTIAQYQSELAYREGMSFKQRGEIEMAERAFARAGDHPGAKAELAQLDQSRQRQLFVSSGDEALRGGDYAAAIRHYDQALALAGDPAVEAKVAEARLRLEVQRGRAALAQREIDQARAALDRARQIDPADPALQSAAAQLERLSEYLALLRSGDELRQRSRFGEAKRQYMHARDVMDTPEVQQRIEDTEYDHLLAQARSFIAGQNWDSARATLAAAGRTRKTDEWIDLSRQVEEGSK